jgi:hypothetical protein
MRLKNVKNAATQYTGVMYGPIRSARTTPSNHATNQTAVMTNLALVQLMREARLRAPHKPLGCGEATVMFRGIALPGARRQAHLDDPSFSSFSLEYAYAMRFALSSLRESNDNTSRAVILVLRTSDVPTGTPWLWFGNACGRNWSPRNKDRLKSDVMHEQEVVLPPGRFHVYDTERAGPLHLWHVRFVPDTGATSISGRRRVYPRSYRPSSNNASNAAVDGYVPLHTLFRR